MTTLTSLPGRVAWDVPVRPFAAADAPGAVLGPATHVVDPGLALPGVTAVRVTVVGATGRPLVAAIAPERSASSVPSMTLDALLASLRVDDVVGVLVAGTELTRAVLDALVRVPVGQRTTYAALAAAAGRPGAVRATASVMARNRVPLLLPCHRVVPSTGGVGRYAWGAAVKAALLDAEQGRSGPVGAAA